MTEQGIAADLPRATWRRNRFSGTGPLHIEHHGYVWMICNEQGVLCVSSDRGHTHFNTEDAAIEALASLQPIAQQRKCANCGCPIDG